MCVHNKIMTISGCVMRRRSDTMFCLKKQAEICKKCHPNVTSIGRASSTDSKQTVRQAKVLIRQTPYQIVLHFFELEGTFI